MRDLSKRPRACDAIFGAMPRKSESPAEAEGVEHRGVDVAAGDGIADPVQLEGAARLGIARLAPPGEKRIDVGDAVIGGAVAQRAVELVGWDRTVLDDQLVGNALGQRAGDDVAEDGGQSVAAPLDLLD